MYINNTGIYTERIFDEMFWNDSVYKAQTFFKTCILPELLGKWYTRPSCDIRAVKTDQIPGPSGANDTSTALQERKYCYCGGPEEGRMIGCDNEDCIIEWFHTSCLKINDIPRGKWYCPDCRRLPKFNRKKVCISTIIILMLLHVQIYSNGTTESQTLQRAQQTRTTLSITGHSSPSRFIK